MFRNAFKGRRVLLTGHTWFKGSWLSRWLLDLGAELSGFALPPATQPSLFEILGLQKHVDHRLGDIRDADLVRRVVAETRPEYVFHLAAQPLVRLSYAEPLATWETNVGGTTRLLEALRAFGQTRVCVVVTSDKCYENREQIWGYRESDPMGGHDPYSSSKGATELAVASWRRSFFQDPDGMRLASARAGNVIGGGDWSADRIVVDFVKAITAGDPLVLRNPQATRPWQHVLEPLSGYLWLAVQLGEPEGHLLTQGWNFGPREESMRSVEDLARSLVSAWGQGEVHCEPAPRNLHEAGLLRLDCTQAWHHLAWRGVWNFAQTVDETVAWYAAHTQGADMTAQTSAQIAAYARDAEVERLAWTL